MYPDPKRIRDNRVTVRLDDYEHSLMLALANYQGEQLASVLRQTLIRHALSVLGGNDSLPQAQS